MNRDFFSIVTPRSIALFCTVFASTALILSTGLNTVPGIILNLLYMCNDSPIAPLFVTMAAQVFPLRSWRPFSSAIYTSTTISIFALACTAVTQFAARFLGILLTISRSRTLEQNVAAIAAQCKTVPFLFLKDSIAEKVSALLIFGIFSYLLYILTVFVCSEIDYYNFRRSTIRLQENMQRERRIRRNAEEKEHHNIRTHHQIIENIRGMQEATKAIVRAYVQANEQRSAAAPKLAEAQDLMAKIRHQRPDLDFVNRLRNLTRLNQALEQNPDMPLEEIDLIIKIMSDIKGEESKIDNDTTQCQGSDTVAPKETDSVANQLPNGFIDTAVTAKRDENVAIVEDCDDESTTVVEE